MEGHVLLPQKGGIAVAHQAEGVAQLLRTKLCVGQGHCVGVPGGRGIQVIAVDELRRLHPAGHTGHIGRVVNGAGHHSHVIAVGQGDRALILGAAGAASPEVAYEAAHILLAGDGTGVVAIGNQLVVGCGANNTAHTGIGAGDIAGIVAALNGNVPAVDAAHNAAGGVGGGDAAVIGTVADGAVSHGVHNTAGTSG